MLHNKINNYFYSIGSLGGAADVTYNRRVLEREINNFTLFFLLAYMQSFKMNCMNCLYKLHFFYFICTIYFNLLRERILTVLLSIHLNKDLEERIGKHEKTIEVLKKIIKKRKQQSESRGRRTEHDNCRFVQYTFPLLL